MCVLCEISMYSRNLRKTMRGPQVQFLIRNYSLHIRFYREPNNTGRLVCIKPHCVFRVFVISGFYCMYVYAVVCGCVSISEIVYLLCDEDMLYVVWADWNMKCANIPAIAHFPLLLCIRTVMVLTVLC